MKRVSLTLSAIGCGVLTCGAFAGDWVQYDNQTSTRASVSANLFASDNDEVDYAWGDLDQDGWTDLVIVRKQPFTSSGRRRNVLLMNENGVLTDRTVEFATAADDGGQGFLDSTNDRDVVITDVNQDGWDDLVTAVTISDGLPKTIGHPRIYINLGEVGGQWQGFEYQEARIPQMLSESGNPNFNPRFCSLAAGDLTGNGFPDLYFGDYDSSGTFGGNDQPDGADFNNKLLINDGNGFYSDETESRLTFTQRNSAFGAASVIADMNDDGHLDIVKQTSLQSPLHVAITYNSPTIPGFFQSFNGGGYDYVEDFAPYFVSAGDLNNDGKLDLAVTDDNDDHYYLQTSIGSDGFANFSTNLFPGSTDGFGGNSVIADFNEDGFNDVFIADVDVDIPGCSRVSDMLRNLGNTPNVDFASHDGGNIPNSMLKGVHDIAVFDINNDDHLDLVMGRCSTTEIWIFDAPPDVPTPADIVNLDVLIGDNVTGNIASLLDSDDNYLTATSVTQGPRNNALLDVDLESPITDVSDLEVTIEVGAPAVSPVFSSIQLFDFAAGQYVGQTFFIISTGEDSVIVLDDISNPGRYVDNDGDMGIRITQTARQPQTPDGFTMSVDQLEVIVSP